MKTAFARLLAPLALSEWGAILVYFFMSRRLAAFLHPDFRPLVVVTGFLLLAAAACLLFFDEDAAAAACDCDDQSCGHSRGKLTTGGVLVFLVLLLPIALASKVAPDGYGSVLIGNRGVAESINNAPGILAHIKRSPAPAPVYVGVDAQEEAGVSDSKSQTVDLPKGWVPPNAPQYSASKNVPDAEYEYPSNEELAAKLRADSNTSMAQAKVLVGATHNNAPLKALNERPGAETPLGKIGDVLEMADSPLHGAGTDVLKTADDGRCLSVEVVDLLVAAADPALAKGLTGKRVELTGQILPAEAGNFRLLRLLILCCAADAQPLAVRVETRSKEAPTPMAWAKVMGKVLFVKKEGGIVPVITAEKITPIQRPDEPYLY